MDILTIIIAVCSCLSLILLIILCIFTVGRDKTNQIKSRITELKNAIESDSRENAKNNAVIISTLKNSDDQIKETAAVFSGLKADVLQKMNDINVANSESTIKLMKENSEHFAKLNETLTVSLDKLRAENKESLDKINGTVNEKLQDTLDKKINESFRTVNEQLIGISKGLGEMQSVASNVSDLKKVLSNVKTRGNFGEVQLESVLQDILAPDQYVKQADILHNGTQVDFAIRFPGTDNIPVYLPIDSKFPGDSYEALVDALNSGSREETRVQVNALMQTLSAPRRRRSSSPVSVQCPTEAMECGSTPAPPENVSSPSDRPLPDTVNLRRRVTVPAPAEEPTCIPSPIARESRHASRDISTSREDTPVSKDAPPLPQALRTVCIVLVFLAMASVCACALMQSYLFARAQAREAAYQAQLTSHPVRYRELIETYAAQYNLQPAYVEAIILNESSYDPKAESRVGARGLMQIMEDTAEWIAHRLNRTSHSFDDLWDPETNIQFGCWYLSYLSSLFGGDPIAVTCAYHAGQGTVGQWLSNPAYTGGTSSLILDLLPTGPTKTYAGRVSQAYGVYDALYYHVLNPLPDTAADSTGE